MKSRLGYLFGIALVGFAILVATIAYTVSISTMKDMQRVAMPGQAQILLPSGRSTLYIETRSKVGDTPIDSGPGDFQVQCSAGGLALAHPRSHVSYAMAGYKGHNAYDVDVDGGGAYTLVCHSDGNRPFAIAIGAGVGAWIVIAVLAVIPLLAGLALLLVTLLRRRARARSSAAATAR